MAKHRAFLLGWSEPCVRSLTGALETQSKDTIVKWSLDYAERRVLPVYEAAFPADGRARAALEAAHGYLAGGITLRDAKADAYRNCRDAARDAEGLPAARSAALACGQAALTVHTPLHAIGMVFYGTAALAYARSGSGASGEVCGIAAAECAAAEASLRAVSVLNGARPARLRWWKNSVFGRRDEAPEGEYHGTKD